MIDHEIISRGVKQFQRTNLIVAWEEDLLKKTKQWPHLHAQNVLMNTLQALSNKADTYCVEYFIDY